MVADDKKVDWGAASLGGLVVVWTFLACLFPLSDFDIWWHLRAGQLILERQAAPALDWFTYTDADKPWIDLHWGFQCLVALLHRRFGVDGIVVAKAATLALAVGIAWWAAGRGVPAWLRAILWVPGLMAIYGRGYERPEVLSLVFLAMWLAVTLDLDRRWRLLPWLILVQLVWVNCHSLFVLGLAVGGASIGDQVLRRFANGRGGLAPTTHGQPLWRGGIVALATAAVCLANPYGVSGVLFPRVVYRKFTVEQEFYASRIGEFQRPIEFLRTQGLSSVTLTAELIVWGLTALSFVLLATRRRWSPGRIVLFVAFSHLAWEAARNTNLFCLVATCLMLANFSDFLHAGRRRSDERLTPNEAEVPDSAQDAPPATSDTPPAPAWGELHQSLNALTGIAIVLAMGLVASGIWGWMLGGAKTFGVGERRDWFAHDAAKAAARAGFPRQALVAHFGQAAVYEFHAGPQGRVFMDGRLEVCTQQTFERWEEILAMIATGDRRWEELHKAAYGELPVVLLDRRDCLPQIEALRRTPGWVEVHSDPIASVFVDEQVARAVR